MVSWEGVGDPNAVGDLGPCRGQEKRVRMKRGHLRMSAVFVDHRSRPAQPPLTNKRNCDRLPSKTAREIDSPTELNATTNPEKVTDDKENEVIDLAAPSRVGGEYPPVECRWASGSIRFRPSSVIVGPTSIRDSFGPEPMRVEEQLRVDLYGSYRRSKTLPQGADLDGIRATYGDGILEVRDRIDHDEQSRVQIPAEGAV